MIEQVTIRTFRALKDVSVGLRPLTVLLGLNDSGKSSFLQAIRRRAINAFEPADSWRRADLPDVVLAWQPGSAGVVEMFQLPAEGIDMLSPGATQQASPGAPPLHETGRNLAAFLDHLLRKDRRRFDQIQVALRDLVPGLEEININTPSPEYRAVAVTIDGGFEIAGERLSTGVRMLFFFVALAHHPNPPDVVLLEEPENGVHPRRLRDIVTLLRRLTAGELTGKPVQVIMTTHSPYLLDHIELPGDWVIVFRREADGRRSATEADAARLKDFLGEFMLGEVWFNQGEDGLLAVR